MSVLDICAGLEGQTYLVTIFHNLKEVLELHFLQEISVTQSP